MAISTLTDAGFAMTLLLLRRFNRRLLEWKVYKSKTRSVSLNYSFFNLQFSVFIHLHVPVEKSLLIQQYTSVTQIEGAAAPSKDRHLPSLTPRFSHEQWVFGQ